LKIQSAVVASLCRRTPQNFSGENLGKQIVKVGDA
jgi:hypothetical protein